LFDFGIAPITTVCTISTLIVQEGGGANAAVPAIAIDSLSTAAGTSIRSLASPEGIDINTSFSSSSSGARSLTLKLDDRSYNSGANARSSYTFKQKAACLVIHDKLVEENPTWTKQAVAEETSARCHIGYDTWKKWLPIKQRDIIFAGWRGDEWAQKQNRRHVYHNGLRPCDQGLFKDAEHQLIVEIRARRKRGRRVSPTAGAALLDAADAVTII